MYTVLRCDRRFDASNGFRGGGVLVAVDNCYLNVKQLNFDNIIDVISCVDIVGCKVISSRLSLTIVVIYIPPKISLSDFETLFELLSELDCLHDGNVIFVGDFNVPNFGKIPNNDPKCLHLCNFFEFLNFSQYNLVQGRSRNLLDLLFSNVECKVQLEEHPLINVDTYHPPLSIDINMSVSSSFAVNMDSGVYDYRRADFPALYGALLEVDWGYFEQMNDVTDMCSEMYDRLYCLFDNYVPIRRNVSRKRTYPPWFSKNIVDNIRKKEQYYKKYKKSKNELYNELFKSIRTLIKKQIANSYKTYINKVETNIQNDPSSFWSYIQSKKGFSRIPGRMSYNGAEYQRPEEIVNVFAKFFKSVYIESVPVNNEIDEFSFNHVELERVDEQDITKAVKKLKNKMTAGVDNVPSFFIKDCCGALTAPLLRIFNKIIETRTFPDLWKVSKVVPVLKKGDSTNVANYRPISILCNFVKIFEMIIYSKVYNQIKNMITPFQHGFLEKKSTVSNLAVFTQYASQAIDDGLQLDVIYNDFQKAFDQIDHHILLQKLKYIGLGDQLIELFHSYLSGRSQYVCYNGFKSEHFISTSGVPQGSNLGPLLFLIFINDLPSQLNCMKLLYADDLKVFSRVHDDTDCHMLQNDLDALYQWCVTNRLKLNITKCKMMRLTNRVTPTHFIYNINGVDLENVSVMRDLGVYFDTRLSFIDHINLTCKAAFKTLGFVVRNSKGFTDSRSLNALFCSLVRSRLEYASLIWSPMYFCHIKSIESVQRRFLKFLNFKVSGIYPPRGFDHSALLNSLNYSSLSVRRDKLCVTFLYKLIHSEIECPDLLCKIDFLIPRPNSRQSLTFKCPRARTNLLLKSPVYNMCKKFNNISSVCDINHSSLSEILSHIIDV